MVKKISPRLTPDRDSKYMGLAWIHAGFSKDPYTQVGAQIVTKNNRPLGSGYNGPPETFKDNDINWERPAPNSTELLSKNDLIIHAEINAIDHCFGCDLTGCTLYVTALPCPACMLRISRYLWDRVVYMDFQSGPSSSLRNAQWRDKSLHIAKKANLQVEVFKGNVGWIPDWSNKLKEIGVFEAL